MKNWAQLDQEYLMHTYQRYPLTIQRARGNYLYDENGDAYLDLFTGLAVNTLGHGHPHILNTLHEQAEQFLHLSNLFPNPPAIRLAQQLVEHTVKKGKVFFANSGAESSDAAIKLIFKWAQKQQPKRAGIIVVTNSFHGRTLGAMQLTRQPSVQQNYPQLNWPVYEVEPERSEQVLEICAQYRPAAILVEPILGSGGVIPLSTPYLQSLQQIARDHNMLFCLDEIQTGMGRTGTLFAYQGQGLSLDPDCILFAKGIGGGLPLGGIIAKEDVATSFQPGDHGSTFAPSPLSAALGNAVFEVLYQEKLLEQGKEASDYLWQRLTEIQQAFPELIERITGRGMMIGIHTRLSPEQTLKIQKQLLDQHFLVNITAQKVIRLLPPLTLTKEEIDSFVQTLQHLFQEQPLTERI